MAFLVSVFLDITVARQVIGTLYLVIIPGFILLKLIGDDKFDTTEKALFSVAFSIVLLLLLGLFINQLGSLIGLSEPLSVLPLIGIITSFVVVGVIISYVRATPNVSSSIGKLELKSLIFFIIPALAVVGALTVAVNGSNSLLLITLALVATVMLLGILSSKIIPQKYYPIIILAVALTLVFHTSLSTTRIHGYDIHAEYNVFLDTHEISYWDAQSTDDMNIGRFGSMLSITILPAIYSNILNMDPAWVLKLIFPLLLSFLPLGIFKLCQPTWGNKAAFVSALLVIVQATFYIEMLGLCREIVAELFFVLILAVFFGRKIFPQRTENFCFILFSFGMIVSHYGTSLIFLFVLIGVWVLTKLRGKVAERITLTRIVFFSAILFGWYMFARSGATMQSIVQFSDFVITQLGGFFNIYSRGDEVALGLGVGVFDSAQSNWQIIGRFIAYGTQLFIIIGFFSILFRGKNRKDVHREYLLVMLLGIVLLGMTIVLPGFAKTLAMTRWYHIALLLIGPLLVLGCKQCVSLIIRKNPIRHKHVSAILIVAVLVPYFLFQTNFVYEVAGVSSWSVPLSRYRMDKSLLYGWTGYVDEQNIFPSQWLAQHVNLSETYSALKLNLTVEDSVLYADAASFFVLRSYGRTTDFELWSNYSRPNQGDLLYLSSLAVDYGIFLHPWTFNPEWNSSYIAPQMQFMDKVYSNGRSGIWIYPPR